jgi:hypothetical protein
VTAKALYESLGYFLIFCAAVAGTNFEIGMGESDRRRQFLTDVQNDAEGSIDQTLVTIEAEKKRQCSAEDDRERTFSVI